VRASHSDLHLLTGAYAVDAIELAELHVFERHLNRCGSCATEIRGLRETAARLAIGDALPPPPTMWQRVMDATYRTARLPPAASQVSRPRFLHPLRPARSVRPARPRRSGFPLPRLSVAVAAGVVAAVSLVAAVVLGLTQVRTAHQLDTARAVAEVLAAPDARTLNGPVAGGGTMTVVVSRARHEAVIITAGLPALSSAEVYQLWVIDPAGARSAGLIAAAQRGRTAPLLASGVDTGDRFGITVEPAGGTTRPTTTPLVVMPLPA
jgi:anti-sigma-K factor RskA